MAGTDTSLMRLAEDICEETTSEYLQSILDQTVEFEEIRTHLMRAITASIALENGVRNKELGKLAMPKSLPPAQVAQVLLSRRHIVRVSLTGRMNESEFDMLCVYMDQGSEAGTYVQSEMEIERMILRLAPHMSGAGVKDTMRLLLIQAPFVAVERDPNLIPVANGIFNHATKQLEPFTPDRVFLMKTPIVYNEHATSPVITHEDGTRWDVDSWMAELHDDPDVVNVYWELLSAVVRNNVAWDKAAFLHSPYGSNGKGTIAALMRELVGEDHAATVQLTEFSDRFALGGLTRARAIITDENDVGGYSERSSKFKAVVTGDKFTIERKHKDPGDISFRGMVIECINDFPKARDKSDSFARRQLFVPFDKRFEGRERKYIKNDYIHRRDVLEYVLKKVLFMNHTTLSEPLACQNLKAEYRRENDSVRDFWTTFSDEFVWDLLPLGFLYDLYKSWYARVAPRGTVLSQTAFTQSLRQVLDGSIQWDLDSPDKKHRPADKMTALEPLISEYDLERWGNRHYKGNDFNKRNIQVHFAVSYRGVVRRTPADSSASSADDSQPTP